MTDCSVCCESFNKTSRRKIECQYCNFLYCATCFRRYLTESTQEPSCMNCRHTISLDFITASTPKSFHNKTYREKRAKDLLSMEQSLLPATQHLAEERQEQKKREETVRELLDEEAYLKRRIKEIRREVNDIRTQRRPQSNAGGVKKERRQFIMGCPDGECRGFLSQAWKCGTCELQACAKCRCVKEEGHVCKKDDLATAEMLKSETKPCPNCAAPIYKVSGCDLMWCTVCHITFSWKTGQRTNVTNNHNPHFYQWQRDNNNGVAPLVPGDGPCGGGCGDLPWPDTIRTVMQQRKEKTPAYIAEAHRLVGHMRDVVMPRFPTQMGIQDNSDLRVGYLLKDIGKDYWLKTLKSRQKKSEKDNEINQVLDMFVTSLTDLFNTYVTGHTLDFSKSAEALRGYVNKELTKISSAYGNKTPYISSQWVCI
jgi:hypothetical protein